jgi:TP901-1 family phage major tail protein
MTCNTNAIPGFDGQVYISDDGGTTYNKIGELREMELSLEDELIDATSHDSGGWRENINGLNNWNITADALYIQNNVAQKDIFDALTGAVLLKVQFRPKDSVGLDQFFGDCRVSSWSQADPNDDAATAAIELQGCGDLTRGAIA